MQCGVCPYDLRSIHHHMKELSRSKSKATTMRARPNATSRRAEVPPANSGPPSNQQDDDCNGKDKPQPTKSKFKIPPKSKFKMPPPPKLASLPHPTPTTVTKNGDKAAHDVVASSNNGTIATEDVAANSIASSSSSSAPSSFPFPPPVVQPVPSVSIPPPPSSTSAVYQRPLRRMPQQADGSNSADTSAAVVPPQSNNNMVVTNPNTSYGTSYTSSDHYPASTQHQQYPSSSSSNSNLAHPYKPSSPYANKRELQRKWDILKNIAVFIMSLTLIALLWEGYHQILSQHEQDDSTHNAKRHYTNYHHHDHDDNNKNNRHFHPMLGLDESPYGFAKESSYSNTNTNNNNDKKKTRSYREMDQGAVPHDATTPGGGKDDSSLMEQSTAPDLFSTVPVTQLSDGRTLPYVGFAVTSRTIEHKQIPIIVSTLLQYASSETEGGGGIAMIDAVIDEDRKVENDGGSMQFSTSRKVVEHVEEEEEKMESSMAKTTVALVGRAISFFGKENSKRHVQQNQKSAESDAPGGGYDYENRLEVHLLVGLSGPDLGVDNTISALRDILAELDGLVPPMPKDVRNADLSQWKAEPSSLYTVDHHVDVRLHVLLRLNHCHEKQPPHVAPCSSDVDTNKELLDRWIGSYNILEKLYQAKIIHGLGLDGIHGEDIKYLLKKCTVKPQIYRGDVASALDIYGRRMGTHKNEHIASILKQNNMTFLASNVGAHIFKHKGMVPNAYALLQNLGGVLYRAHMAAQTAEGNNAAVSGEREYYTMARVVLSYLVRHKVVVLPHAFKPEHLADDAPESVGGLANFLTERRVAEIGAALRALLSEVDLPEDHGLGMEGEKESAAVFHNMLTDEVHIFNLKEKDWPHSHGTSVKSAESAVVIGDTGDKFAAYGSDGKRIGVYTISGHHGGAVDYMIPSG